MTDGPETDEFQRNGKRQFGELTDLTVFDTDKQDLLHKSQEGRGI